MSIPLRIEAIGDAALWAELPVKGMLVIGSSKERAGLVVHGQGIEDAHCAIGKVAGGGWAVKDLGSEYGVLVNGERVSSRKLAPGDVIVLGSRRLRVADPGAVSSEPEAASAAAAAPAPAPAPATRPSERAPRARGDTDLKRVGGYRLDKLLGRGGMGRVFLALQESLNRPVALKLLSKKLAADHDFVRRFQEEARAAAALNHPNVVVVHDVGEADGHHYLSMEFMAGGSLEERVAADGPLPWRQVLDVLHDAGRGLMFAEERGIVHRDIKPANLMFSGTSSVKIADLGLATTVEAEATQDEGKKIYGTPHFISPEQAKGGAPDHRSDLYSLGATAYRLLTGKTPFEGESTRDILRAHFTEDPAPPSEHMLLPQGLNDLVLRLLAKEPDERFQRAAELVREVERLRLEADHGAPAGASATRSRAPLAVGGIVLVLVIGAVALGGLGGSDDPEPDDGSAVAAGGTDGDTEPGDPFFSNGTEGPTGSEDGDEEKLRVLELEAQNAYLRIGSSLTPEDRIAALENIIDQFEPTDTARRAREEIGSLREEMRLATAADAQLEQTLSNAIAGLKRAAGWPPADGELPRPGHALRGVLAFQPPSDVATDTRFTDARVQLMDEIVATSTTAFRNELDRAKLLAGAGDFAQVGTILDELTPRFDFPEFEADDEPAGLSSFRLLASEVRARSANLAGDARAWGREMEQADRAALAGAFGPKSGFEVELAKLDLAGIRARVDAVRSRLKTEGARKTVGSIDEDLTSARAALDGLVAEFGAGGWRRRSVSYPRGRRDVTDEAIGADADGIRVQNDGGSDLVPWAAFGSDERWIHKLFQGRLERSYGAAERAGILALLRMAAVAEAATLASEALDPDSSSSFTPANFERMSQVFEHALEWAAEAGPDERARVERERAACGLLAAGLLALQERSWSNGVAALESLFAEYSDTLLVGLLSDGTEWRAADPAGGEPEGAGDTDEETQPGETGETGG